MVSTVARLSRTFTDTAEEALHLWRHRGLAVGTGLGYALWRRLLQPGGTRLRRRTVTTLAARFEDLLQRDLANARAGYYPRSLLHQFPALDYVRAMPEALLELPRVLLRSYLGRYEDLPAQAEPDRYPRYYRRNFHWQSDGWLSERSARLYDASVEFLFGGTADVMRRMAIPPLVDAVAEAKRPRILDVACGTGRFLAQLGRALPQARLYGLDMSPFYVRHAQRSLDARLDVTLVAEDAVGMPWADGFFDAVASVYLFHELPQRVRRQVVREIHRVLRPGGTLVICDSAQLSDSAVIADALYGFAKGYHEPYYKSYLRDDLSALLIECGMEVAHAEPHLVSKVAVARKPLPARRRVSSSPGRRRRTS
ncbi:MAG TPA: class I SAM-dependent methyltransferase [Candidatus Binatia bacterium]|nr:class I SAM-dependent methyltransferase [Candidatus Binatia bacterium]